MADPVDAGGGDERGRAPDRRGFTRVELRRQVLLRLSAELTFRGFLQNISQDAVQVLCEPRYALLIHPQGDGAAPYPIALERFVRKVEKTRCALPLPPGKDDNAGRPAVLSPRGRHPVPARA